MNFKDIENGILTNRGNKEYMEGVIASVQPLKEKYANQMDMFLDKYCKTPEDLENFDLGGDSKIRRFYDAKCAQYREIERIIRVAKAYS